MKNSRLAALFAAAMPFFFNTAAFAEDITNPFYMPLKGKGLSETAFSYTHSSFKRQGLMNIGGGYSETSDDSELNQRFEFGLTDRFTFIAGVGNFFEASGDKDTLYWNVGGRYAFFFENTPEFLLQMEVMYSQLRGGDKEADVTLSFGYDAGATVLPYGELSVMTPMEQGRDNNESKYGLRLGAYSVVKDTVAVKAGLDAYYDREHNNYQSYSVFAEAEYIVSPTVSVSLSGSYMLHDTFKYDANAQTDTFSVGAGLKVAF